MSYTKRYLEEIVDELAKELDEDWCEVNDIFMNSISDGLSVEDAIKKTKMWFITGANEIMEQLSGGYSYEPENYDPLRLWDRPWYLFSEDEKNSIRENLEKFRELPILDVYIRYIDAECDKRLYMAGQIVSDMCKKKGDC